MSSVCSVPTHCLAAAAVVVGASVVASQLHTESKVPSHCIAASMLGSATVAGALVHHGSLSKSPAWYCVVGGVGGAGAIGYSLMAHSENSKMPLSCKLYTLAGVGLIIAGAAALAKAK